MKEFLEKRNHDRREISQTLQLERWYPDKKGGENVRLQAECFDISAGGVGIYSSEHLTTGEVLKLDYPVNGNGTTVPIYVVVVWCEEFQDKSRVGLQFLH